MKNFLMVLIGALACVNMSHAAEYRLYNVVPMYIGHEAEQAARCVEMYARTGEDLALYSLTLHPEGRPAMDKVNRYVASYRAFAKALEGTKVRPAILVQAILGHWPRADKDVEPWERTIDQDGKVVRFCPSDPGFGAYIESVFRLLAAEKPAFILTDDDVRAFSHGAECFCASHVKLFNARHGTSYNSDFLRAAVAAAKPGESVYEGFMVMQREMIERDVVARIRAAIDAVDPTIPAGICVSGSEHYMVPPMARAIAAKGQKPVMRCATGLYIEGMSAGSFPRVFGRMLGSAEYCRGLGIDLLDEADTCPHNLWSKSARSMFTHLVASCFVGMQGAKTWYVNTVKSTGIPVTQSYTDVLAENRGYLSALATAVDGSAMVGFAMPCFTNHPNWHVIHNHKEYFVESETSGWAAVPFGVPFGASRDFGDRGRVFALTTGREVSRLSDADLRLLLSGRVFVFRDAAIALTDRGFADLIGAAVKKGGKMFTAERDNVQGVLLPYASALSGSVTLEPVAGAERLGDFVYAPYAAAKEEVVAPSTVHFRNRLGGEVIVAAYHSGMYWLNAYSEVRKRWFVNCIDRLSARDARLTVCGNDQHMLLAEREKPDGTRLVMAVNLNSEPVRRLSLRIPEGRSVAVLSSDGTWRPVSGTREGEFLLLSVPVGFYEAIVVRISAATPVATVSVPVTVSIADYGAKADGTKATAAFAAAIDAVHKAGGGRVEVPAGEWLTGAIHLKSNVELHLDDRARIVFSDDLTDYLPVVLTTFSCIECYNYSPLVYAYGCTNVAVTGGGVLTPRMDLWRGWFNRETPEMRAAQGRLYAWGENDEPVGNRRLIDVPGAKCRPSFIEFVSCQNVRLKGFRVRESPCWVVHLRLCEDVHVDGLDLAAFGHNSDGVDIDASRRVLVENCRFAQGDDGVVIKSGRDRDGRRVGVATEDVEIRNCTLLSGHTLLAVGSEVSGGVRNVLMRDCQADGVVGNLIRIKTSDRKGAFVENVVVSNIVANSVVGSIAGIRTDVNYQWERYPARERIVTRIEGFHVSNVRCAEAGSICSLRGDARLPARDVTVRDVSVGRVLKVPFDVTNVVGFVCENVRVKPDPDERAKLGAYRVTNTERMADEPRGKGTVWPAGRCPEEALARLAHQGRTFVRCSFDAAEAARPAIAAQLDVARRCGIKVALHLRGTPEEWHSTVSWLHYRNAERAQALFAYDLVDSDEADALDAAALRERQHRLLLAVRASDSETPVLVDRADLPFRMINVIYKKRLRVDGAEAIAAFQRRHGCRICVSDAAESSLPSDCVWDCLADGRSCE